MYQLSFFPGRTGIQTQNRNENNDCDNLKMASCHAIHPSNGSLLCHDRLDYQDIRLMMVMMANKMSLDPLPLLPSEARIQTA